MAEQQTTPSGSTLPVVETRCRHLLSKGLYINAGLPKGEEAAGDGHYWCAHTQTIHGPDQGLCDIETCCDQARGCWEE